MVYKHKPFYGMWQNFSSHQKNNSSAARSRATTARLKSFCSCTRKKVYNLCLRMSANPDDALDLVAGGVPPRVALVGAVSV